MSLTEVKDAIRRSVQAEADAVLEAARAEGAQIVANARSTVIQKRALFEMETERIKDVLEHKELATANTMRKAIILRAKRDAIESSLAALSEALDTMNASERNMILTRLAARAEGELGTVSRVQCNTRDVKTLGMVFPEASIIADATIRGGLIAQDASGTVSIDLTYTNLVSRMRDEDLTLIASILFDGGSA